MFNLPEKFDRSPLLGRMLATVVVAQGQIILSFGTDREIRIFRDFVITRNDDPDFMTQVDILSPPPLLFTLLTGALSYFGVSGERREPCFAITFRSGCILTVPLAKDQASIELVMPGQSFRI